MDKQKDIPEPGGLADEDGRTRKGRREESLEVFVPESITQDSGGNTTFKPSIQKGHF